MTRHGIRIDKVGTPGAKSLGISYSLNFELWQAAIAAGATLEELSRLDNGGFDKSLKAKLITWFRFHELIELHRELARQPKSKK